jgi:amidase
MLIASTCNAMQFVAEMDDYQLEPDYSLIPRDDVYFPATADNPDDTWAYRFRLSHKSPKSDLLAGKTFCIKDNIAVTGGALPRRHRYFHRLGTEDGCHDGKPYPGSWR